MFSGDSVLPPGFVSSEVVHVRFPAKKRAYLALGRFLNPVVLHVITRFHLGLLLFDAGYAILATRVLGPRYYHLAFEWLDFCLVDFIPGRPKTWLFVLKKEEVLATRDFVRLCVLHNLCNGWKHKVWLLELTA